MCVCLAPCCAPLEPLLCDRCIAQRCNALAAARIPRSRAAHTHSGPHGDHGDTLQCFDTHCCSQSGERITREDKKKK